MLVTEMFLGHTEKGMKKHYAERHFKLLDEAVGGDGGYTLLKKATIEMRQLLMLQQLPQQH